MGGGLEPGKPRDRGSELAIRAVKRRRVCFGPSTPSRQRGFGTVTDLISKKRNRPGVVKRGDSRLVQSHIGYDTKKLVENHRVQTFHSSCFFFLFINRNNCNTNKQTYLYF